MNVLSLFDGMSCGRIALEKAGIKVDKYYASEIDKYAIQVSEKNYPNIIRLGDVTQVKASELPKIDLLIGGSPCQGFSFAGKQLNFDDPRSKLFFEYVRLLKECKPEYFLLENVCMKKEYQQVISEALGVEPILINSALVSAQNRKRLYWTNIPGVEQPKDRGILLEDVLDDSCNTVYQRGRGNNTGGIKTNKSPSMTSSSWEHNVKVTAGRQVGRARENGKRIDHKGSVAGKTKQEIEINQDPQKTNCLSTVQKDNLVYVPHKHIQKKGADNRGQRTGCIELGHADLKVHEERRRVYSQKGKSPSILAASGGYHEKKIAVDVKHWRKLTPLECERLQTVPDGYTEGVSNTQRYKMLGNGWTVDVIAHIFKGLKDSSKEDEQ